MAAELVEGMKKFSLSMEEQQGVALAEADIINSNEECGCNLFGLIHGSKKANFAGFCIGKMFSSVSDIYIPEICSVKGRHIKILAAVNLEKPLLRGASIKLGLSSKWVSFKYENMVGFCFYCGLVGHPDRVCEKRKKDLSEGFLEERQFGDWLRAEESLPGTRNIRQPNNKPKTDSDEGSGKVSQCQDLLSQQTEVGIPRVETILQNELVFEKEIGACSSKGEEAPGEVRQLVPDVTINEVPSWSNLIIPSVEQNSLQVPNKDTTPPAPLSVNMDPRNNSDGPNLLKWNDSWIWKSWLQARYCLLQGLGFKIGDEKSIRAWNSPWIPGCQSLTPLSPHFLSQITWVSELLNPSGSS
ncbi:hypothetical protein DH2020_001943 [Rehmannia glutinosa]|uniref:Zinc knuckle CX2CX4HX4C domain-containing protein n=1 Tax=Rehmannia glutinosa TaxID=99300 RepID=A0ABR0XSB3_REHGL